MPRAPLANPGGGGGETVVASKAQLRGAWAEAHRYAAERGLPGGEDAVATDEVPLQTPGDSEGAAVGTDDALAIAEGAASGEVAQPLISPASPMRNGQSAYPEVASEAVAPPEEDALADAAAVRKPLGPTGAKSSPIAVPEGWPDITDDLAEIEFLQLQGLRVEAGRACESLRRAYPGHPDVLALGGSALGGNALDDELDDEIDTDTAHVSGRSSTFAPPSAPPATQTLIPEPADPEQPRVDPEAAELAARSPIRLRGGTAIDIQDEDDEEYSSEFTQEMATAERQALQLPGADPPSNLVGEHDAELRDHAGSSIHHLLVPRPLIPESPGAAQASENTVVAVGLQPPRPFVASDPAESSQHRPGLQTQPAELQTQPPPELQAPPADLQAPPAELQTPPPPELQAPPAELQAQLPPERQTQLPPERQTQPPALDNAGAENQPPALSERSIGDLPAYPPELDPYTHGYEHDEDRMHQETPALEQTQHAPNPLAYEDPQAPEPSPPAGLEATSNGDRTVIAARPVAPRPFGGAPAPTLQPAQPVRLVMLGPTGERLHERSVWPGQSLEIGRDPKEPWGSDTSLELIHARVTPAPGGGVTVEDFNNPAGVFRRLTAPVCVRDGDEFRVGQSRLVFRAITGTPPPGVVGRLAIQINSKGATASYDVPNTGLRVGREQGDVTMAPDTFVSSDHCRFLLDGGDVFLEDLGSSNGSYQRIRRGEPQLPGACLLMGQTRFKVEALQS